MYTKQLLKKRAFAFCKNNNQYKIDYYEKYKNNLEITILVTPMNKN